MLICAEIPPVFLSQEILEMCLCQFKITRQILKKCYSWLTEKDDSLTCFTQLLFFFFFLLQTSASVLAEELHKV